MNEYRCSWLFSLHFVDPLSICEPVLCHIYCLHVCLFFFPLYHSFFLRVSLSLSLSLSDCNFVCLSYCVCVSVCLLSLLRPFFSPQSLYVCVCLPSLSFTIYLSIYMFIYLFNYPSISLSSLPLSLYLSSYCLALSLISFLALLSYKINLTCN